MNKIFKAIINLKYLIFELFIFAGAMVTFGALSFYLIIEIITPFILSFPDIAGAIFSFCFIFFYIFALLNFTFWILNVVSFFTKQIKEIFTK